MGHGARRLSNLFSKLASRLAVHGCVAKSMAIFELYARLNISLMRANSRAMLSRLYQVRRNGQKEAYIGDSQSY